MMRVISFTDLVERTKRETPRSLYNPQFDGFIFTTFEDDEDYNDEYNTTSINFIKDVLNNMYEENKENGILDPTGLMLTLAHAALVLLDLGFEDDEIVYVEMDI